MKNIMVLLLNTISKYLNPISKSPTEEINCTYSLLTQYTINKCFICILLQNIKILPGPNIVTWVER